MSPCANIMIKSMVSGDQSCTMSFQADYGQAQKDDKEITITTYFDCTIVTVKTHNPSKCKVTPPTLSCAQISL